MLVNEPNSAHKLTIQRHNLSICDLLTSLSIVMQLAHELKCLHKTIHSLEAALCISYIHHEICNDLYDG